MTKADGVNRDRPMTEPEVLEILLEARRSMLRITSEPEARSLAEGVVFSLGGMVGPATAVGAEVVPIDISFGDGQPVVPVATPGTPLRAVLDRHLPALVEDIRLAVALGSQQARLATDALTDHLTGLANRRMMGRVLGRVEPGDVLILIDLDHFKRLNDEFGHEVGDEVLRCFGAVLRANVRGSDAVGRFGGEEFLVVLRERTGMGADALLERLERDWQESRPHPVTFSAGIAVAGDSTPDALRAADVAMYEAKAQGRDTSVWAHDGVAPSMPVQLHALRGARGVPFEGP